MSASLSLPTESQLNRLIYSNWDFQQSLSALTFLMQECDFHSKYSRIDLRKFRCYEASVVTSFARPFENSRGQTTLGLKAIGVRLNTQEKELKEQILNLRRKVIAHSDENFMHFRGEILRPFEDSPLCLPFFHYVESLYIEEAQCKPLEELLRKLIGGISKALFQLAQDYPDWLNRYKQPDVISEET